MKAGKKLIAILNKPKQFTFLMALKKATKGFSTYFDLFAIELSEGIIFR